MNNGCRLAYISDQVFYCDGGTWYTSNGFPLAELVESAGGAIDQWTFFGRLVWVERAPEGALAVTAPGGLRLSFVGPRLKRRGFGGYLRSVPEYLRLLRHCIRDHDVLWIKANFVAAWIALPLLIGSKAFRISHQVGDPGQIAVGPRLLLPGIRFFAASMTRLVHRVANLNVFVSRQLSACYGIGSRESWVYNESRLRAEQFIDPKLLSRNLHRPIRLLYVGRLSPEKGVSVLLRAVASLELNFDLRLAGHGRQQGQLEGLASTYGVRDRIHFLGAISWGRELFDLMRDSDILILPSHTEGLPLVLLEAMSQGLLVIASNVGGIPEVVRDGHTGLLFPVEDADALADAIVRLARDEPLRTKLRENALKIACENTLDRQLRTMFERLFTHVERAE